MIFYDILEEDIDQINLDYVQTHDLNPADETPPDNMQYDDFYDFSPEIGTMVTNIVPTAIVNNDQFDNMNPINASIKHQKYIQFKKREDIINTKEHDTEFDNNNI